MIPIRTSFELRQQAFSTSIVLEPEGVPAHVIFRVRPGEGARADDPAERCHGDAGTKDGRIVPESPNPPGLSGNRSVARWLRSDKGAERPERYIPASLAASPASSLEPGLPS